jgi:RNA polymerase sigma-70 factor (ECF subfamily)
MSDHESQELLAQVRAGADEAAEELFARYAERLIALVRVHLSEKFAARFDPEDVVQTALRSFFCGVREGRYLLHHSGDLWRLLASIARHKLQHQVARHSAERRTVTREISHPEPTNAGCSPLASIPSPSDAIVVADEIEWILNQLSPTEQRMFELRLEGYTLDEIAEDIQRSQRTVRRTMQQLKQLIHRRIPPPQQGL